VKHTGYFLKTEDKLLSIISAFYVRIVQKLAKKHRRLIWISWKSSQWKLYLIKTILMCEKKICQHFPYLLVDASEICYICT